MGLENVFGQPEKVEPEKKLEVIASEEAVIADWMAYFEKNKIGNCRGNRFKEFKLDCQKYLQSYQIKSAILQKFVSLANQKQIEDWDEKLCFGAFLSALIQTSYNQGNNDFEFDFVTAEGFASFLHGEEQNLLRITLKALYGNDCLGQSSFCFLKAGRMFEGPHMYKAQHCILEAEKNEVLTTFYNRKNCRVKIGHARYLDKKDEKS